MSEQHGYEVDQETGEVINAPCGCPQCSDQVQPGHFACSTVPTPLMEAEEKGLVDRAFDNGTWKWFVN